MAPIDAVKRSCPDIARLPDSWPSLENGDHMKREEFHRRYLLRPDIKKAELIEGIVYIMSSPVRARHHGGPHKLIMGWLIAYEDATPGTDSWIDATVRLGEENEPRPDAILRLSEACGGRSRLASDDYFDGPPELVVEIAGSTVSNDLHQKKTAYRTAGVREYLVWRTEERLFDWFRLDAGGDYERVDPGADGIIESSVFPGLRLAVKDLLAGNLRSVRREVALGVESEAHRRFAMSLKELDPSLDQF